MKTKLEGKAKEIAGRLNERITAVKAPLDEVRAKRDAISKSIAPQLEEINTLGQQIKDMSPELAELENLLGALHKRQNAKLLPGEKHINEIVEAALD
jgi:uncharacterized coiled-coil DUF342 family protein